MKHNLNELSTQRTGYMRLSMVLKLIPISKSLWWEKVKSGEFPQPVKLTTRTTAWKAEDIHQLIKTISENSNRKGM